MNGSAPKRCTGTLCDFFYGGPPPEEPTVAPTEAAIAPERASDEAATAREPATLEEAPSESDTRPNCAADARDPCTATVASSRLSRRDRPCFRLLLRACSGGMPVLLRGFPRGFEAWSIA